jgi:hypothetical protein
VTDVQPEAPAFSLDQIQAMIAQAIAENTAAIEERHQAEIIGLQDQLNSQAKQLSGLGTSTIADHSAGVGTNVHETWSQFEQELARIGQHPLQLAEG